MTESFLLFFLFSDSFKYFKNFFGSSQVQLTYWVRWVTSAHRRSTTSFAAWKRKKRKKEMTFKRKIYFRTSKNLKIASRSNIFTKLFPSVFMLLATFRRKTSRDIQMSSISTSRSCVSTPAFRPHSNRSPKYALYSKMRSTGLSSSSSIGRQDASSSHS